MTQAARNLELWPTKPAASTPKPAQSANGELFAALGADLWLAHHLFRCGRSSRILEGVTGFAERRERIRFEIKQAGLAREYHFGERSALSTETFAEAFERLYAEPL